MPRDVHADLRDAFASDHCRPVILFTLALEAQTLRLWDGTGPLEWNSNIYLGNGWLSSWSAPVESQEIRAEGYSVILTAVPLEVMALLLNEAKQGLQATLHIGNLDDARRLETEPALVASGALDVPEFTEDGNSATVQISFESDLINLDAAKESRYTDAEQQRRYPGDVGFQYVADLADKRVFWGVPGDIPRE